MRKTANSSHKIKHFQLVQAELSKSQTGNGSLCHGQKRLSFVRTVGAMSPKRRLDGVRQDRSLAGAAWQDRPRAVGRASLVLRGRIPEIGHLAYAAAMSRQRWHGNRMNQLLGAFPRHDVTLRSHSSLDTPHPYHFVNFSPKYSTLM